MEAASSVSGYSAELCDRRQRLDGFRGTKPLIPVLIQQLEDYYFELTGNIRRQDARRHHRSMNVLRYDSQRIVAFEWHLAGREFIKQDSQRVQIVRASTC